MIPSYHSDEELVRLAWLGYQAANDSCGLIEWGLRLPDLSDYMRERFLLARRSTAAIITAWEKSRTADWETHDARRSAEGN